MVDAARDPDPRGQDVHCTNEALEAQPVVLVWTSEAHDHRSLFGGLS
jgi:hypothetical protein